MDDYGDAPEEDEAMNRRCVIVVLLVLAATFHFGVSVLPENVNAAVLYVGGTGPGNYTLIRYAIENASVGDTIFVYNGTYKENVVINKMVSLVGENRNTTIIDGFGSDAIEVESIWVNVTGFSLVNASGEGGVNVSASSHCRVFGNGMYNNHVGITATASPFLIISDNVVSNNTMKGVDLYVTNNASVSGNYISSNALRGIDISSSSDSNVANNTIIGHGIGIEVDLGMKYTFYGNVISTNSIGVDFAGIGSSGIVHNNFINNTLQASDDSATNSWDGGYPTGGNYWSDYTSPDIFHGPAQTESGADGIVDTPRPIVGGVMQDGYPLTKPFPPPPMAPPTAPLNLQAAGGNTQVTLTWEQPAWDGLSPVTNFAIYRGTAPGGETYLVTIGNVTTHVDAGLTNGVTYCYEVAAINAAGEGIKSNEACAIPARLPGRPRQLSAVGGDSNITLDWQPPGSDGGSIITNYTIYRGLTSGGEVFLVKIGAVLTYLDTGLTNGVTYYYTVTATNIMGEGPNSTEASGTPMGLPSEPLNLQAAPGDMQVVLSWNASASNGGSSITNYEIYRGTTPSGEIFLVEIGNITTHTDIGLTNGQRYYYKVSARNAVGEGPLSGEASATPDVLPSAPRTLTAVPGNTQITLTWLPPLTGNPLTIAYNLYRGPSPGTETLLATGVTSPHVDTGLTNGVQYCYQVTAVNGMGEGPRSNEVCAIPATLPTAPRSLVATGADMQITLDWIAPASDGGSPIANYEIYRGSAPGAETFLREIGNVTTFLDSGLTNGQTYYYMVSAKNALGEGPRSAEAQGVPGARPTSPQNLRAARGDMQITLAWDPPVFDGGTPIINYTVYRGTFAGGETLLIMIGNVLSYLDAGLTNGVTYYYKLSATNLRGEGPMSNEVSAIPATTPQPPTIFSADGIDEEVILTIIPPTDSGGLPIMTYKLFRGTAPGAEVFIAGIGTPSKHYDAGLTNGVTYYYRLSAVNEIGESGLSTEISAMPMAPPSPPLSLTATEGDGQVQLVWLAPSDDGGSAVTSYKVHRGTVSGGETLLATIGNILVYTDSSVTNRLTYFYKVSAINAEGEGAKSNEASATPHAPPTIPGAPQSLQATSGLNKASLSWQPPISDGGASIVSYTIYRGTTPTALSQIGSVAGMVTSFVDVGVAAGTTYYYQVSAANSIGEGPKSNTASVTVPGAPGQPTGLSVVAGTLQAFLTWAAPASDGGSPITNYRIYRGTSPGSYSLVATTGNIITYTDGGLTGGQTYYYTVSAVNAIGEGLKSAEQSVAILQPPNNPPDCAISSPAQGATVSGNVVVQGIASDIEGTLIVVEIRIDGGEWKGTFGTASWSYMWNTKLFSNGQHTIDARAYDGTSFSQVASVTVTVDNPAAGGPAAPEANGAGIAVIVILLIMAVLLLFLAFRRRPLFERRKAEPEELPIEETENGGETLAEEEIPRGGENLEEDTIGGGFLDDDEELI